MYLIGIEVGHEDTADTFFCFGRGNYIPALYALERLCYMDDLLLKVEVSRC